MLQFDNSTEIHTLGIFGDKDNRLAVSTRLNADGPTLHQAIVSE